MTATVRPHPSRNQTVREALASYRKEVQDMADLPSIVQEVSKMMGLRGYADKPDAPAFASDVLQIDITGPLGLHLSIVDLPGLVTVANDQQTEEDIEAVHAMVAEYLQNSRTIILAVIQASSEIANQPIIKFARKYDTEGQRTVGIITKADLINKGAESAIARIAKNEGIIKLKLGFFLVKNPTPADLKKKTSARVQFAKELQYFQSPPWSDENLDMDRVGVENLRRFLQNLLDTHIERELPSVRNEIRKRLADTENKVQSLGEVRQSVPQIRSFLSRLSMKLYELLQAALDGNYRRVDPEFFGEGTSRLRARVQELNFEFAERMRVVGKRRRLEDRELRSPATDTTGEPASLVVTQAEMMEWVKQV